MKLSNKITGLHGSSEYGITHSLEEFLHYGKRIRGLVGHPVLSLLVRKIVMAEKAQVDTEILEIIRLLAVPVVILSQDNTFPKNFP